MKIKQLLLISFIIVFINITISNAQTVTDTIKLMTYNVGNFGTQPSGGCPLYNLTTKSNYLRTILNYAQPDIIGMAKINGGQQFCTDTIVTYALDYICNGCWGSGNYTNASGYYKEDMLYFNTNKFGLAGTTVIYSNDPNISDITLHKLYYKSQNLSTTHDTIFLRIVLAHLVSGSTDTTERAMEIAGAMTWLNTHITSPENLIFMGDFNTTASTEGCFRDLIASANANTKFYDPPNQLGQWSNSPSNFANYLTQSTRTNDPGDCLATGGINNRFDHILITSAIKNGTDSIKYIPSSYTVVGQDGQHTGHSLQHSPSNSSVPANVDSALYYMSEHLPVSLNMKITYPLALGIADYASTTPSFSIAPNPNNGEFIITFSDNNNQQLRIIEITDVLGRIVNSEQVTGNSAAIDMTAENKGIYFVSVITAQGRKVSKLMKE